MQDNRAKDACGAEKLTDAELSKKLGRYQALEQIGMVPGILMVIAGCISAFVLRNVVVLTVLAVGGVGLILLVGMPAQRKKKDLIHQQLGSEFHAALERAFGPEPQTPELPIDTHTLADAGILAFPWTACRVTHFHEGMHNGLRFSAANVELDRTVDEGANRPDGMTKTETLFRGIVVRCKEICAPDRDLILTENFQERKQDDLADPAVFRRHFTARTSDGRQADAQVTPQLRALVQQLEAFANHRKLGGLVLRGGTLTLALNTGYVFADVPQGMDVRNIDAIRTWFARSLTAMGGLLDLLRESPALAAADGQTDAPER